MTHNNKRTRARTSIAVHISTRCSSLGLDERDISGCAKMVSQAARTSDKGNVCERIGDSHRLRNW
jgi:hypothetical protein